MLQIVSETINTELKHQTRNQPSWKFHLNGHEVNPENYFYRKNKNYVFIISMIKMLKERISLRKDNSMKPKFKHWEGRIFVFSFISVKLCMLYNKQSINIFWTMWNLKRQEIMKEEQNTENEEWFLKYSPKRLTKMSFLIERLFPNTEYKQ